MTQVPLRTRTRTEFLDVTADIRRAVYDSGVASGACVVYCPHTTAGLTIQENADPDVVRDILLWLNAQVPKDVPGFRHAEGNSDAHIKSALVGQSVTVLIDKGELVLGTWQGVYFCEFDGPRQRVMNLQILAAPKS